jgi:hypothetical protein
MAPWTPSARTTSPSSGPTDGDDALGGDDDTGVALCSPALDEPAGLARPEDPDDAQAESRSRLAATAVSLILESVVMSPLRLVVREREALADLMDLPGYSTTSPPMTEPLPASTYRTTSRA